MAASIKTQQTPQREKVRQQKRPEQHAKAVANPQQVVEAPETLRPEDLLSAQQQYGNQAVQRALDDSTLRKAPADAHGNLREDISASIQQARGSGSPLPKDLQTEAGRTLGHNFDAVRIHTDAQADALSRSIQARAFTIGSDIFFKSGAFSPVSGAGRETLIHELTHVVQQSGSHPSGRLKLGPPGNALEHEAERMGKKAASSATGKAQGAAVQRWGEEEEIQTQPEAGSVQRQGEEEEIQTQPEAGFVQRQGEEEEIQTQPEPGTVQRWLLGKTKEDEDVSKKASASIGTGRGPKPTVPPRPFLPAVIPSSPQTGPSIGTRKPPLPPRPFKPGAISSSAQAGPSIGDHRATAIPEAPPLPALSATTQAGTGGGDFAGELSAKAKQLVPSNSRFGRFKAGIKNALGKGSKDPAKDTLSSTRSAANEKRADYKMKLIAQIENAGTSAKEADEAQEKLKDMFGGDAHKNALKNRKNNLMKAAQGGDQAAYQSYKSEHTLVGKAKFLYGKHKDSINTVLPMIKEHGPGLLGGLKTALGLGGNASKSGGESAPPQMNLYGGFPGMGMMGPAMGMMGPGMAGPGGGGGGMVAMMQEYARLKAENEDLKKQVASSKPAESTKPVEAPKPLESEKPR
jgi:hypothetical protein